MTDIMNAHNTKPSTRPLPDIMKNRLGVHLPFLLPIFSLLLIWAVVSQFLYMALDAPDIGSSQRASIFAVSLFGKLSIFVSFLVVIRLVQFILKKDSDLTGTIRNTLKSDPTMPLRWLGLFLVGSITFIAVQTNFMAIKTVIPELQPFYLDEAFHKFDRALFLGSDPWQLFAWMFNFPWLVSLTDNLYNLWSPLLACVWVYAFTTQGIPIIRRYQYIFATLFLWLIGGNILATFLSSAGPVYYEVFQGGEVYRPLIDLLNLQHGQTPLKVIGYQDYLLDAYYNKNSRFAGISAAPSLHCATTLLLPIFFWKNKMLRYILLAFTGIIFIGSVILAWHYVADGLISIPLALACWWFAGKLSTFLHHRYNQSAEAA